MPLLPLRQLSLPLPQFHICSGPVVTPLHLCTALHSFYCPKCKSQSTYVNSAEQELLPSGSEDKAEAWRSDERHPLEEWHLGCGYISRSS